MAKKATKKATTKTVSKGTLRENLDDAGKKQAVLAPAESLENEGAMVVDSDGSAASIRFVTGDGLVGYVYSELSSWQLNSSGTDLLIAFQSDNILISGTGLERVEEALAELSIRKIVEGAPGVKITISKIQVIPKTDEED